MIPDGEAAFLVGISIRAYTSRLVAAVALPLLIITVLLIGLNSFFVYRSLRDQAMSLATVVANYDEGRVSDAKSFLNNMISYLSTNDRSYKECDHSEEVVVKLLPKYGNFAIVAPDGHIFCSSLPLPSPDLNFRDRKWFWQSRATTDIVVTDPLFGVISREWIIVFSRAMRDSSGAVIANANLSMSLKEENPVLPRMQLPAGAKIGILSQNGVIVAHSDGAFHVGTYVGDQAWAQQVLAGTEGFISGITLTNFPRLLVYKPVAGSPWKVFVSMPRGLWLVPMALQLGVTFLIWLGLVAFAVARGRRVSRQISGPIEALSKAVAENDGKTPVATLTSGPGEIVMLSRHFGSLLQRSIDLEQHTKALLIEETRARQRGDQLARAKDDFLMVLSHELRTPLTAIQGWAQVLRRGLLDPQQTEHALSVIETNVRLETRLIQDLLDLSSVEEGRFSLNLAPIDIRMLLVQVVESYTPAAQARNITMNLDSGSVPLEVCGDAQRLQQVVWNLLSNALKFTPPGGTVSIKASRVGQDIQVKVSDSGIGISKEQLPHVFERFWAADSSTTRAYGGLGIGLTIAREIVLMQRGTLTAQSDGKDKGATFIMTLPAHC